jgi:hypothetical protein
MNRIGGPFLRGLGWWIERHRGWRPLTTALLAFQFACVCWWLAVAPEAPPAVRWLFRGSYVAYVGLGFVHAPRALRELTWRKRPENVS